MFGTKLKWYLLFEERHELETLLEYTDSVVHRTMFGEVLLVKNEGEFHAFRNRCPHQKKPLNGCVVEDRMIVCPHHHYAFSCVDGRGQGLYIDKYELKFEDGKVFLGKEVWSFF